MSSREIEGEDALEVEPNVVGREHERFNLTRTFLVVLYGLGPRS